MKQHEKSSLRYLLKHPIQLVLSIIGVAIGVAVVISIDISSNSAMKAFEMSMDGITGKTTQIIHGSPAGIPDSIYYYLKLNRKLDKIAPVVEQNIITQTNPPFTLNLLGVDVFAEKDFRDFIDNADVPIGEIYGKLLSVPNSVLVSYSFSQQTGKSIDDTLKVKHGGEYFILNIVGILKDKNNPKKYESLAITDISTAKRIFLMDSLLSRIDLIIDDKSKYDEKEIAEMLPENVQLTRSETRTKISTQMISAFNLNLTAMSLLALIVGMFLIYNTMTFSVVQRRKHIGLLRSLGITRREIFTTVMLESLAIGLIGTIIGIFLGILLGNYLLGLVTQSINDLYFVITVRDIYVSQETILKTVFLGILATVISALKPAYESTKTPPRLVVLRSFVESEYKRKRFILILYGLASIGLSILIFAVSGKNVLLSFIGVLPLMVGFTMFTPALVIFFTNIIKPLAKRVFGVIGAMASKGLANSLSRIGIAISALAISLAAAIGVGTMVNSFRITVVNWLETRLQKDIYISVPTLISRFNDATIPDGLDTLLEKLPEVKNLTLYRELRITEGNNMIHLIGSSFPEDPSSMYVFKEGDPKQIWTKLKQGEVMVTEPYSYRTNKGVGDSVDVLTDKGMKKFRIAGVHYDYGSDIGLIFMEIETYRKFWDDRKLSGLGVFLKEGYDVQETINKIRNLVGTDQEIIVRSNKDLLKSSIEVFDRTFIVTNVLQILAIIVAFIGVLSALMSLQLERTKEIAIYRANGMTPRDIWKYLNLQTGIMGLIAGILSIPLGNILALVLIYVINKRSFGWTLQFNIIPELLIEAVLVGIISAILASIYPAYKMSRISPSIALREE
ncbi:MAG: FtsX-like permease family protein [Candidatus Kapabacteria bacterium]|nr:FtsX-like permease family protein [Candidatus Kapabacteria bacterium]